MTRRDVTLGRIESDGAKLVKLYEDMARRSYMARYGIRNPWSAWIMAHDPASLARPTICLWDDDYASEGPWDDYVGA